MFDELLNSTTRGNYGNLGQCLPQFTILYFSFHQFHFISGMYFDHPEIVPDGLLGDFRFNKGDEAVAR